MGGRLGSSFDKSGGNPYELHPGPSTTLNPYFDRSMTTSIADPENSAPSDYQESALDMDAVAKLSSRMINHKFPNCKL